SQRKDRETDRFRLGKTASQKAKAANTLREIPRRISGSMFGILSIMATQLTSHFSAYHAVSLHSISVFERPRLIDNRGPQLENRSVMWSRRAGPSRRESYARGCRHRNAGKCPLFRPRPTSGEAKRLAEKQGIELVNKGA